MDQNSLIRYERHAPSPTTRDRCQPSSGPLYQACYPPLMEPSASLGSPLADLRKALHDGSDKGVHEIRVVQSRVGPSEAEGFLALL